MYHLSPDNLDALWARHHAAWRASAQVASQWQDAIQVAPQLLHYQVQGTWWKILADAGVTLLITREYEHLLMAMRVTEQGPVISYLSIPHPSGIAVDQQCGVVYVASTRNPNQVYDLAPVTGLLSRLDVKGELFHEAPLIPVRSRFFPGCLYMHDLALIDGRLHANAVGQNAVIHLHDNGSYERVWWPRCIETGNGPVFGQNHLQLNSIAAGSTLSTSYFSASTDRLSRRRPGHKNFPVDKRGVIFSGATHEVVARGLTRPHSARLYKGKVWVDNSGYGEVGYIEGGAFIPVAKLPGWTRGLCFHQEIMFVGVSRVIPRFRQYAPGLEVDASLCGIYAVDTATGQSLGSLIWPAGNQIFAIETIPVQFTSGFPFAVGRRATAQEKKLFYTFKTNSI